MSQLDQATTLARRIAQADLDGQTYGALRTELVETLERQIIEDYRGVHLPDMDRDLHLRVMACSRADRLVDDHKAELTAQRDSATTPEPEVLEKVTFNLDASKYGYAGTATVVATDPAALKLHAEGNSVRRHWRVDSIDDRRVTELDPAAWIAKYAR